MPTIGHSLGVVGDLRVTGDVLSPHPLTQWETPAPGAASPAPGRLCPEER
jgi:hypothetical protein